MNGITIMVPTLSTVAQIGSVIIIFLVLRACVRSVRRRGRQAILAADQRQEQLRVLFPSPWNEAWDKLIDIESNPDSRTFLRHWLSEQKNLPRLSRDAVHKLACELTFEYCCEYGDECLTILDPYTDEIQSLEKTECLARREREQLAEKEAIEELFHHPWNGAYRVCASAETREGAQLWLEKWIGEQSYLPAISIKAAEKLTSKVTGSLAMLAPYLDTGYSTYRDSSDCNLEQILPKEWFELWKEIKDYPSRRMLFMTKRNSKPPHPVFHVPLTSEQAALLARALGGGCETKTEFYASDLARCVAMTAEIKADEGDCNRKEEARVCGHTEQEDRDWYTR